MRNHHNTNSKDERTPGIGIDIAQGGKSEECDSLCLLFTLGQTKVERRQLLKVWNKKSCQHTEFVLYKLISIC
jgi:hypothetical protein